MNEMGIKGKVLEQSQRGSSAVILGAYLEPFREREREGKRGRV